MGVKYHNLEYYALIIAALETIIGGHNLYILLNDVLSVVK